ncbi:MAG: hypothetical protein KGI38_01145 [Thaumarchaeota archaeon]|nr:hypothetical protein [Nitrososphaerota archaeon]
MATVLIHCPTHYLVGAALGIRFRSIRLGRTTLARVLPERLASLARLLPLPSLSTVKASVEGTTKVRAAATYASGTVASVAIAFVLAGAASAVEPPTYSALAWAVAMGYLLFDLVFSPKSGDLMRARRILGPGRNQS